MSRSFMFQMPCRLPLTLADFGPDYAANMPTGHFPDREALMRDIASLFPGLQWREEAGMTWASATSDAGWVEPHLFEHDGLHWSLRCSMSGDYSPLVQAICDRMGWVAIDETASLFQPHRDPIHLG